MGVAPAFQTGLVEIQLPDHQTPTPSPSPQGGGGSRLIESQLITLVCARINRRNRTQSENGFKQFRARQKTRLGPRRGHDLDADG